ncbi:Zinc metalloproteinase [Plakobranchus ocellatus]|uniref:Zinc metalloproteinase n=1 Tax=Plakobranchus ocellatus TaxID=259542 RepID=A0AAV4A152_9GAST|nr:Zinc metalloproteinase [Plakobranchus ocellatus]
MFPLPLLVGETEGSAQDGRVVVRCSTDPAGVCTEWPVVEGNFKVLVRLQPGENMVTLRCGQESLTIRLRYDRPGFAHFVRPVYIVCADDDGYFQGPGDEDCSPESAVKRIALGSEVIQTLTAEKMHEHGFGRVTFSLETDDEDQTMCHIFHSKLRLEEAYSMTGYELWSYFGKELMTSPLFTNKSRCKFYCFMSFTRYNLPKDSGLPKTHSDILKHTKGHTALGGGGLALFGTGNLHTWADSVASFSQCMTNRKKMDRRKFMDDSAYREYYWANYATGLGASLHELGHTFDLAHTPTGIMARGFDDLHKVFTVQRQHRSRRHQRCERQRQRYNSGGSSSTSGMSRTSSSSSTEENSSSLGSSQDGITLSSTDRAKIVKRQTDVCYGSPYKQACAPTEKVYIAPPPLVVSVESGFKPTASLATLTFSVKNYDGSETRQTIMEGQMVSELTVTRDGTVLNRLTKERRPSNISLTSGASSASISPSSSGPSTLPNSPEEPPAGPESSNTTTVTMVTETSSRKYRHSGAHWYRSSAIVLRFHKWFNKPDPNDTRKSPSLHGPKIKSLCGLRLVELRTDPEGCVFHHWEFLNPAPPTEFILRKSKVTDMPTEAPTVTVMAVDSYGNILKKRFKVADFV